jgi:2,4-dienoyl-CoA reductase-like NADH-dependent reductase (Old Yellow Enzyme family)
VTTSDPIKNLKVFTPGKLGTLVLKNRFIRSGCFEGMSHGGEVTQKLIDHHRAVAAGGVAMTTVAYCSVSYDGRAFGHELWMRKEIIPGLRSLTDAVHSEGAAASIQLGHCGFFADPKVIGAKTLGASAKFCTFRMSRCKEMSEKEIEDKINDFADAARMSKEAGFDAIEIHAGHGYLLSQFLSPWTNKRKDKYGGSMENRMRFPSAVISRVREAVGHGFPVLVKMNQSDGINGGLEINESAEVAKRFASEGASAIIPSCGFTAKTPLYMMRGNVPTKEMAKNRQDLFSRAGLIMFGRLMVQRYPFKPMFLIDGARNIKDAVNIPVTYVGGAWSLPDIENALHEGFEFIQIGRPTVRDPDFVKKLKAGEITGSDCDFCNRCIATMDAGGVYCVSREKGLYSRKF